MVPSSCEPATGQHVPGVAPCRVPVTWPSEPARRSILRAAAARSTPFASRSRSAVKSSIERTGRHPAGNLTLRQLRLEGIEPQMPMSCSAPSPRASRDRPAGSAGRRHGPRTADRLRASMASDGPTSNVPSRMPSTAPAIAFASHRRRQRFGPQSADRPSVLRGQRPGVMLARKCPSAARHAAVTRKRSVGQLQLRRGIGERQIGRTAGCSAATRIRPRILPAPEWIACLRVLVFPSTQHRPLRRHARSVGAPLRSTRADGSGASPRPCGRSAVELTRPIGYAPARRHIFDDRSTRRPVRARPARSAHCHLPGYRQQRQKARTSLAVDCQLETQVDAAHGAGCAI